MTLCLHGLQHCRTCHRERGECDFGSCHEKATVYVVKTREGRVIERRPMCDECASTSIQLAPYDRIVAGVQFHKEKIGVFDR